MAERMLKPVPLGRCLPPKADLRLFRGRSGGEGEHRGGMSFPDPVISFVCYYFLSGRQGY